MKFELPLNYEKLNSRKRKLVREQYVEEQKNKCFYCGEDLSSKPSKEVTDKPIFLELFPPFFLKNPIHLQHDHNTGLTEGAVHAYCNAVMWQYENR